MLLQDDLPAVVQPELEAGERIRWTGQPDPIRIAKSNLAVFAIGLVWTAGAIAFTFGFFNQSSSGPRSWPGGSLGFGSIVFYLFMLPFLTGGYFMLSTPFRAYRGAQRTVYAITDKRILVVENSASRKVQSHYPASLGPLERTELPDGSGDLVFAKEHYKDSEGDPQTRDIKFVGIPSVRTVEKLVRELLKQPD